MTPGVREQHAATTGKAKRFQDEYGRMTSRVYEITFAGEAVPAICAAFEDFDVAIGTGSTTLRAELVDQAALYGALDRVMALGLELLEVRAVDCRPRPSSLN
jgi:hypothetical protein